jgi:hypothetical protein
MCQFKKKKKDVIGYCYTEETWGKWCVYSGEKNMWRGSPATDLEPFATDRFEVDMGGWVGGKYPELDWMKLILVHHCQVTKPAGE